MAITISGQNNNDKILASDGVLDQISGFNVVGVMTATTFNVTTKHTANHIDVGSTVQLGNAGIITATTLIGNVTGNVNSTSNLLLQISGSEKFRVGNGGQFGIAGANYGTAGQVFTSGGSGSAPTWSTINSDKITEGNTEAEVVDTGSDGHFKVTTEGSERLRIDSSGRVMIGTTTEGRLTGDRFTIATNGHTGMTIRSGTSAGGNIFFSDGTSGDDELRGVVSYDHTNNFMRFYTNAAERLRIDSAGNLSLGKGSESSTSYGRNLQIHHSGTSGAAIHLTDNNTGSGNGDGFHIISTSSIAYLWQRENANMVFGTNGAARWNIYGSNGHLAPNADSTFDIGTSSVRVRNGYFDTLYGDGSNLTGITGTTINNNANNRLITGSGTANTLEGESTLTYDGNQLKFGAGSGPTSSGGYYDDIKIDNSDTASGEHGGTGIEFISGNQSWAGLIFSDSDAAQIGYVKYTHIDNYLTLAANGSERMRFLSTGVIQTLSNAALILPQGTTAQRPTAATGMTRFNSTTSNMELYNGSEWLALKVIPNTITLYYLVIGGGGAGGGNYRAGGGGAGAYRTNWNNEAQGGGNSVAAGITVDPTATPTYSVIIGAGGSPSGGNAGGAGGTTTFGSISCNGGSGGGRYESNAPSNSGNGSGGGGGGHNTGSQTSPGAAGTYGYAGGNGSGSGSYQCGGGGGGAAGAGRGGNSSPNSNAGDGGSALANTITGSSVLRAGGGGAGAYGGGNSTGGGVNGGPASGGGGAGRGAYGYRTGESATANTGSGGGGSPGSYDGIGGSGGSGVIILRYSNTVTATYTGGVTKTTSTIGQDKIDIITATSNSSQTVTFS